MSEANTDPNPDTSPAGNGVIEGDAPAHAMAEPAPGALTGEPMAAEALAAETLAAELPTAEPQAAAPRSSEPPPSFVKLAMRNMVRKGRQSLLHFGLTAVGFIGFILLVAWFGRPTLPQ